MNKIDKTSAIAELKERFEVSDFFYVADSSQLSVEQINKFRRLCFQRGITVKVVKNKLAKKALESFSEEKGFEAILEVFKGPSTLLFADNANLPAKVIKEFREAGDRPLLKGAYISKDVFIGDDQIDTLRTLKSKEDLIGDVLLLLQSPIKNVLGSLQSGGNTIGGILKALEDRA